MENLYPSSESHLPLKEAYSPIKVRCPECLKLYAIDPEEIKSTKPKFQCLQCKTKFWLAYPESLGQDEIIGIRWTKIHETTFVSPNATDHEGVAESTEIALKPSMDPCPQCHQLILRGISECPKCGVLIQRFLSLKKLREEEEQGFPASRELRRIWTEVIDRYDDKKVHQDFIHACQNERNLAYAARQYGKILSALPSDEMGLTMRDQIVALTQLSVNTHGKSDKPRKEKAFWNFTSFIIFFSTILIVVGLFLEPLRNMVGVGVAIIFFTLAFSKRS